LKQLLATNPSYTQRDHPALLKAKYCLRVAAVSHTQENTKTHVTLTSDLQIKYGWRGCQVHVHAKFH